MTRKLALLASVLLASCHPARAPAGQDMKVGDSRYLYLWAGDADKKDTDFLAIVDVDPGSPTYATIVATVPAGAIATQPHHTEHEMPASGILWANGFNASRTFRFDLRDPARPLLAGSFGDPAPFGHPHSYARLPNGNVLATFQWRTDGGKPETGGLVELDSTGQIVRSAHASTPADTTVRPYSLLVLPSLDRVVSTATDMHGVVRTRAVQIWRLSDLTLLHTIQLPPGRRGDENSLTAEPRLAGDGKTVMVNTFTCGLYRLDGLTSDAPSATWVYSSPWAPGQGYCAVPVVAGRFWLQPSGPERTLVSLDLSDPAHPREAGRITFGPEEVPHWIAREPGGNRVVITGYKALESRVMLATIDTATGRLQLDSTFSLSLDRPDWPHGPGGRAIPHGAVFSRE